MNCTSELLLNLSSYSQVITSTAVFNISPLLHVLFDHKQWRGHAIYNEQYERQFTISKDVKMAQYHALIRKALEYSQHARTSMPRAKQETIHSRGIQTAGNYNPFYLQESSIGYIRLKHLAKQTRCRSQPWIANHYHQANVKTRSYIQVC